MVTSEKISIIAFVDKPELYKKSDISSGLHISYYSNFDTFMSKVIEDKYQGLILDIQKVMNIPTYERNRIFSVAATRPLMRTKIDSGKAVFIDNLADFKVNCQEIRHITTRMYKRVEVNIPIQISAENDPAMANSFSGTIQNISQTGCYITADKDVSTQDFLHLKIDDLSNKLPIYAGIRWTKSTSDRLNGFGVKFITIAPEQTSELLQKHITPNITA